MLARSRFPLRAAGLLSLLLVTSCGGSDSTSPKQQSLSAEDTQAFVVALDDSVYSGTSTADDQTNKSR